MADSEWPSPQWDSPIIAWTADQSYLHDPSTGRTFVVGHDAAQAIEVLITCGDPATAQAVAPDTDMGAIARQLKKYGVSSGGAVGMEEAK